MSIGEVKLTYSKELTANKVRNLRQKKADAPRRGRLKPLILVVDVFDEDESGLVLATRLADTEGDDTLGTFFHLGGNLRGEGSDSLLLLADGKEKKGVAAVGLGRDEFGIVHRIFLANILRFDPIEVG